MHGGCDRERGAIAILLGVLLIGVLLPLVAAGVSAYVRAGTAAELQRSADSAALAGARSIPLGDLSAITPVIGPVAPEPLTQACNHARSAVQTDSALGGAYAGETVDCEARYLSDPDFLGRFQNCISAISGNAAPPLGSLFDLFRGIIPALHHPGIEITLSRRSGEGPIDGVIPSEQTVTETRTARAVRRFKNAIVVPVIRDPSTGRTILDLNIAFSDARMPLLAALAEVELATEQLLPECGDVVDALADDLSDLYNPNQGAAPDAREVVADAQAQGAAVMAFVLRGSSGVPCLLCGLQVPVLEFMPLCVSSSSGNVVEFTGCSAQAVGAFRASLIR